MPTSTPLRITRAGRLGRAELEVSGTTWTVLTARSGSIAAAGLAVRAGLTALDLASAAGRARAADRLVGRAAEASGCAVLISVGGDIATAGPPPAEGWRVRLDPGGTLLVLPSDGGMATVRSAEPGSLWRSVTVLGGSCLQAHRAAMVAAVRPDAAVWLDSTGLAGRLVGPDRTVVLAGRWQSHLAAA